jgi:hypothetical protein
VPIVAQELELSRTRAAHLSCLLQWCQLLVGGRSERSSLYQLFS